MERNYFARKNDNEMMGKVFATMLDLSKTDVVYVMENKHGDAIQITVEEYVEDWKNEGWRVVGFGREV